MDINNIKPPADFGPSPQSPAEVGTEANREATFADVTANVQASHPEGPFPSLSQCSKASLDVPEQLEAMVRTCVSELVDSGQQATGQLSHADKQSLTEFLSGDPLIRQQIESYLRKVAT